MALREVARFHDRTEAHAAMGLLDVHGIPGFSADLNHISVAPYLRLGLVGAGVSVPEEDYADAKALLGAAAPQVEKDVTCSACGGRYRKSRLDWMTVIPALFFGVPFVRRKRQQACPHCSAEPDYAALKSKIWRRFTWAVLTLIAIVIFVASGLSTHLFEMRVY